MVRKKPFFHVTVTVFENAYYHLNINNGALTFGVPPPGHTAWDRILPSDGVRPNAIGTV